jgi:hypothetical protein
VFGKRIEMKPPDEQESAADLLIRLQLLTMAAGSGFGEYLQ